MFCFFVCFFPPQRIAERNVSRSHRHCTVVQRCEVHWVSCGVCIYFTRPPPSPSSPVCLTACLVYLFVCLPTCLFAGLPISPLYKCCQMKLKQRERGCDEEMQRQRQRDRVKNRETQKKEAEKSRDRRKQNQNKWYTIYVLSHSLMSGVDTTTCRSFPFCHCLYSSSVTVL